MAGTRYTISLIDRVTRTAARIQGSLVRVQGAAQKASASIDTIGLIAGGAAVAGIFKLGAELESTQLKFNTLTGSVEQGTKLFDELTQFANATPFSNQALNKNASTLLAFGAEAEDVTRTLKMLGDIAAGDQERLGSLTLAFAQSKSAGRLMGQDLLQMINAGFNPLQIMSEKTGLSMMELKKQMEKGLISFDLVEQAFRSATEQGGKFHGLTQKMSQTMAGKWSTVMGKAKFLVAEVGLSFKDIFLPFLERAINGIDRISQFLKNNNDKVQQWGRAIATFLPIFLGLITALKIFNAVASANPYALAIVGIAALITFVVRLTQNFNEMSSTIDNFFDQMGWFGKIVFLPLRMLWVVMRELTAIFKVFRADGFVEGMKRAGKSILRFVLAPLEMLLKVTAKFGVGGEVYKAMVQFREYLKFNDIEKIASDATTLDTSLPGITGAELPSIGLSPEAQKLQAQGVVSGGIKTFNININQVTGVETLSTTTIEESAEKVGDSLIMALTKALADIKNID